MCVCAKARGVTESDSCSWFKRSRARTLGANSIPPENAQTEKNFRFHFPFGLVDSHPFFARKFRSKAPAFRPCDQLFGFTVPLDENGLYEKGNLRRVRPP